MKRRETADLQNKLGDRDNINLGFIIKQNISKINENVNSLKMLTLSKNKI